VTAIRALAEAIIAHRAGQVRIAAARVENDQALGVALDRVIAAYGQDAYDRAIAALEPAVGKTPQPAAGV
jgi:hypothetical protein